MIFKKLSYLMIIIGFVVSIILPFVFQSNGYLLDIFISIMIWSAVAQSWILLAGNGGMYSLGHIAFFGLGAYTTAYFASWGIPTIFSFPVAMLVSGIVALMLGFFVCRLSGHYFSLVTFVFTIGMGVLFRYYDKYTGGDYGITIPLKISPSGFLNMSWDSQLPYYFLALSVTIFSTFIIWMLTKSSFGYKLSAIREDMRAARAVGIRVFRIRLITFCVSASLAASAGTVYVSYFRLIEPNTAFSFHTALNPIIYSIAGGIGNLFGGIIGAVILVPLSSYLNKFAADFPGIDRVVYGLILMLIILFLPKGILGLLDRWKNKKESKKEKEIQSLKKGA
ncbi:branched-chain amino acid ABC transporter permease [Virgibacillus byunsanensis]|uniref:Branched-chain amino acid ABC transporter permease n=1 Tax=Virgibacillus byunsanensis TaxID=570945 RepID=A0ABW3LKD9_9BACI